MIVKLFQPHAGVIRLWLGNEMQLVNLHDLIEHEVVIDTDYKVEVIQPVEVNLTGLISPPGVN